jgi:FkbM family methyltransferase
MTVLRPIAFVLAASNHGTMIVNRNDYRMIDEQRGYGVGFQILSSSSFDQPEVNLILSLLRLRQRHFGDGVVAIDGGANIGVHTVEWARAMTGWGSVTAFEAQERIYYALAGNIVINNCLNASVRHAALGGECGIMRIPQPDYLVPATFGSLELRRTEKTEFIGQEIDYAEAQLVPVHMVSIDSLDLPRIDLIKLDVEGMEEEVLVGAARTLERARPVLVVEVLKSDRESVARLLTAAGYRLIQFGINLLAVHESDPVNAHITIEDGRISLA